MPAKNDAVFEMKRKIVEKSMILAAEMGWDKVSLRDIAAGCDLSLAKLYHYAEDKGDILVMLGKIIDQKVLENAAKPDEETPPRDRLFDILMDRYEALNTYRGGIIAVLESFRCDPKQAVISLPHLCRSMNWMLEAAGLETQGLRGAARVMGLTGVYLKVLKDWRDDDAPDLAKTMAALDKALGRAEQAAQTFGL